MLMHIRKFLLSLVIFSVMLSCASSGSCGEYDPQNTMLALNMAIVSVHRILATQDRIVLDQEYQNIINNLNLANIENDPDMLKLYRDLLSTITRKRLRDEDAKFFTSNYDQHQQNLLAHTMSNINVSDGDVFSFMGSLAVSCVSSYFAYYDSEFQLSADIKGEFWQLMKEDIEDCNHLQESLLNSSWNLLRQYKLPDSYRLVQRSLDDFYKAVNEKNTYRRLRMLRSLEREFQVYPPYWYYRAIAARDLNDNSEALLCFEKFDRVWRPVLRQDPYKVEAVKFRISKLGMNGRLTDEERHKAIQLLEIMEENTARDDWVNNLFAGIGYFLLGDKKKGIDIVEINVDFGYGVEMSTAVLNQLKADRIHFNDIPDEMKGFVNELIYSVNDKEAAYALSEWLENDSVIMLERLAETSSNPVIFHALSISEINRKTKYLNYSKADFFTITALELVRRNSSSFYTELIPMLEHYSRKGRINAKLFLGDMYQNELGVERNFQKALELFSVPSEYGNSYAQLSMGIVYLSLEDYDKSIEYLMRSAKQNNAYAYFHLGLLHGAVKEDNKKAAEFFFRSAEQGLVLGCLCLGDCFYSGNGVPQNYREAYKWYSVAVLFGGMTKEEMKKIEGSKTWWGTWNEKPLIEEADISAAKTEARMIYEEIMKRRER